MKRNILKNKKDVASHMKNHPKYCLFHYLIGYTLEDCHGFKSWHKSIKSGVINLLKKYFEMSSTCYSLTIKEIYDDKFNHQDDKEEPQMINSVRRLLNQAHGTKDK